MQEVCPAEDAIPAGCQSGRPEGGAVRGEEDLPRLRIAGAKVLGRSTELPETVGPVQLEQMNGEGWMLASERP